jgi:hypothetical protein
MPIERTYAYEIGAGRTTVYEDPKTWQGSRDGQDAEETSQLATLLLILR